MNTIESDETVQKCVTEILKSATLTQKNSGYIKVKKKKIFKKITLMYYFTHM